MKSLKGSIFNILIQGSEITVPLIPPKAGILA
jgi:hypothetical protein